MRGISVSLIFRSVNLLHIVTVFIIQFIIIIAASIRPTAGHRVPLSEKVWAVNSHAEPLQIGNFTDTHTHVLTHCFTGLLNSYYFTIISKLKSLPLWNPKNKNFLLKYNINLYNKGLKHGLPEAAFAARTKRSKAFAGGNQGIQSFQTCH